ncbi:MAG: hypothetical protein A3I74_00080 [Candidatus Magasanikbacteria bacterium RIFCSPLOWO2_02_FULL_47_16]|nr:MAG: hypothetical protein A3I74_00080 [Candidatus Magasanikbacteria bacterium RIFCSPLOWO2_02_FULL_47_16]OGN21681.1 MAG: hypothetical protein A2916_03920 [Candidatus Yanofskybacteria bacterium RIFCSPLOWO2_01_FULL_41_67]
MERFEAPQPNKLESSEPQKKLQRQLHFDGIELTPEQEFPINIRVRKEPIEVQDGDSLGSNSVEVKFEGEALSLMEEAEKLSELPEEERLAALTELVRSKLKYPYPDVMETAGAENPELKEWLEKRFGPNPSLWKLELNDFLKNGFGDCKIMAAAYLVAAQSAKMKGIYANSGVSLRNVTRPDTGKPVFRSVELDRDTTSAHAWVEIQLSDGRWIPVDPTTNMVGLGEMIEVFRQAGYNVPVAFKSEVPSDLELERDGSTFGPGESEKELHLKLKIGSVMSFGKGASTKRLKTDKFSGNVDIKLNSSTDSKSTNLDFIDNQPLTEENKAEQFFANNIDVVPVSKEEFLEMVKLKYPDKTDEEILQTKGINFDQDGKVIILLRDDVFPEEYMPYMETHEKWEAYVARKEGFNLFKKAVREYKGDKEVDLTDDESKKEFYDEVSVYNYDFRHEYAVYKEYQQAMADGKLDEYHKWILNLREQEKSTASQESLTLIENDTKIRESVYKKLTQGTKHYFNRQ